MKEFTKNTPTLQKHVAYKGGYEAVVIGVSSGGLKALQVFLPLIPGDFPVPIMIVQHREAHSGGFLVEILNEKCKLQVKEADDKEKIVPGKVYLASANYHMMLEDEGILSFSIDDPVHYARPSIDVLFETAADVFGSSLIGILLTGASNDGSLGLKRIQEQGGVTIVQNPQTAEVSIMPQSAIDLIPVNQILDLEEIPQYLIETIQHKRPN